MAPTQTFFSFSRRRHAKWDPNLTKSQPWHQTSVDTAIWFERVLSPSAKYHLTSCRGRVLQPLSAIKKGICLQWQRTATAVMSCREGSRLMVLPAIPIAHWGHQHMAKDVLKKLCCWQWGVQYRQVTELQEKGVKWKGWGFWGAAEGSEQGFRQRKTWDWGFRDTPDTLLVCFSCCPTQPRRSSLKPSLPRCPQHTGNNQHRPTEPGAHTNGTEMPAGTKASPKPDGHICTALCQALALLRPTPEHCYPANWASDHRLSRYLEFHCWKRKKVKQLQIGCWMRPSGNCYGPKMSGISCPTPTSLDHHFTYELTINA